MRREKYGIKHLYKGHKIMKILTCGQTGYHVQGMPDDFYKSFWNGIFGSLKEAKQYIDRYEAEESRI